MTAEGDSGTSNVGNWEPASTDDNVKDPAAHSSASTDADASPAHEARPQENAGNEHDDGEPGAAVATEDQGGREAGEATDLGDRESGDGVSEDRSGEIPGTSDMEADAAVSNFSAESAPEEVPGGPAQHDYSDQLAAIERQLAQLTRQLRDKDATIAALHDDLQKSLKGVNIAALRPMFMRLGRIVAKISEDLETAERDENESLAVYLDAYRIEVINTLGDMGLVEEPETDLTDPPRVDTKSQRIRAVVEGEPEMHQRIAKVVSPAFSFEGALIVPELVDVYRARKGEAMEPREAEE